MKIVAAGGTGFIGRHVVRALLDAGHDVTVLGRDPARAADIPLLAGATAARGDVTDAASLAGTLDGADAVVMSVTFPNYPMELPRKGLTFERYEGTGSANLVAEAKRAGVRRFLYVSGAGADETSTRTWYRAKGIAERTVVSSGLDYAIVRPSWVYGPEDKSVNKIATMVKLSPVVPRLGVEPQRIQPLYVDDLAAAIAEVFARDDAWNATYELGGPDVMTMEQVVHVIAKVLGKRRAVLPIPKALAKIGTAPLVLLPRPPMTPGGVDFAAQDGLVDLRAARKVLGFEPVGLEEGLSRYLAG